VAKSSTAIIGACGEHYVAAYLSGFQLVVAIPRAGVPGLDMLVAKENPKANYSRVIRVQVKTGTQATRRDKTEGDIYLWSTSCKVIDQESKDFWFAYVWLNGWPTGPLHPEVFFVPSGVVAKCMKTCREERHSWPYFWMRAGDAKNYLGAAGLQLLLKSLDS
jgi:hypothetical protein